MSTLLGRAIAVAALGTALLACGKPPDPNAPLVDWLEHEDGCVRTTAAAIIASGRPWPNEVLDDKRRVVRFDFWIGNQLYEIPASGAGPLAHLGSPTNSPLRYSVFGNAEQILGVPKSQLRSFKHPGVGATLYGDVRCHSHLPQSMWVENRWTNALTRGEAIEQAVGRTNRQHVLRSDISERADVGMTEVKSVAKDPDAQRFMGATYFPIGRDLTQEINGKRVIKGIPCARIHDPDAPLGTADLCSTWLYLGPGLWIEFQVYQQMLPIVPDLHDRLLKMFEQARRK